MVEVLKRLKYFLVVEDGHPQLVDEMLGVFVLIDLKLIVEELGPVFLYVVDEDFVGFAEIYFELPLAEPDIAAWLCRVLLDLSVVVIV